jgi:glycosyltransferase involved in cell wall biosynthesis
MVSVASRWQKEDLVRQYGLAPEKVRVVPAAPVVAAYPVPTDEDLADARRKFQLPPRFVFYPAQTWPHKNHTGLLEALALLRDREGLVVPLVSSGKKNDFYAEIERRARELKLEAQLKFVGFVTPLELQALYRTCRAVVFPTLFEGFGMPLVEAFQAGAPVACSNVTSLPEQAGDAALVFDPRDTEEMASAVHRLWTDDALARTLVGRGRERVRAYTWERTALTFRAHYRRLTGRPLDALDVRMTEDS